MIKENQYGLSLVSKKIFNINFQLLNSLLTEEICQYRDKDGNCL